MKPVKTNTSISVTYQFIVPFVNSNMCVDRSVPILERARVPLNFRIFYMKAKNSNNFTGTPNFICAALTTLGQGPPMNMCLIKRFDQNFY